MSEIVSLLPGESGTVTLIVDYNQYYLVDDDIIHDLARGTDTLDGVIGPQNQFVQVATGVQCGKVTVILHLSEPTEPRDEEVVSAEADLELSGGNFVVTATWESKIVVDWSDTPRLRVRVVVRDRDAASTFEAQETHEIWAWPTSTPQPRWRSSAIDTTGRQHAMETAHLRAQT